MLNSLRSKYQQKISAIQAKIHSARFHKSKQQPITEQIKEEKDESLSRHGSFHIHEMINLSENQDECNFEQLGYVRVVKDTSRLASTLKNPNALVRLDSKNFCTDNKKNQLSDGEDYFDLGYSQFSNFQPDLPQLSETKNSEISLFKVASNKQNRKQDEEVKRQSRFQWDEEAQDLEIAPTYHISPTSKLKSQFYPKGRRFNFDSNSVSPQNKLVKCHQLLNSYNGDEEDDVQLVEFEDDSLEKLNNMIMSEEKIPTPVDTQPLHNDKLFKCATLIPQITKKETIVNNFYHKSATTVKIQCHQGEHYDSDQAAQSLSQSFSSNSMDNLDINEHQEFTLGVRNSKYETPNDAIRIHERVNPILEKKKTSYTMIQGNINCIQQVSEYKKTLKEQKSLKLLLRDKSEIKIEENKHEPKHPENILEQAVPLYQDERSTFTKYNFNISTHDFDSNRDNCSCNFDTLLAISECKTHSKAKNEFKMPNQLKDERECEILKQGWVKKKTTNIFLGFQDRYLVLYSNKKLIYYKLRKLIHNDSSYKQKTNETQYTNQQIESDFHKCGEFDLNVVLVQVSLANPSKFQLQFTGLTRQFIFQTFSNQEAYNWKFMIENIACTVTLPDETQTNPDASKEPTQIQIVQTPSQMSEAKLIQFPRRNFWKYSRMCEQDFREVADTGDIILFKNPEIASQLQRVFTSSNYNHIAVVLKCSTGKIKFIEATVTYGVDVIDWEDFVYHRSYRHYERIVYRKLICQKTKDQLQNLEKFIKVARSKRYGLAASKLLRKRCVNDSDYNIKQNKTYFCSELAASIYKNMGLLPKEKAASQYWPVNFSRKKEMKLLNGAFLDEEKLIEFDIV